MEYHLNDIVEMKKQHPNAVMVVTGCYAQLVGKDAGYAQLKLSSGELRVVREECLATVGDVSNPHNKKK